MLAIHQMRNKLQLKYLIWVSKMNHWIKVNSGDVSSIPGTHIKVEGETKFQKLVLRAL